MIKTVQELNTEIGKLYAKHRAELVPYENMFEAIYEAQMAACETLDEQWEVYKNCPPKYLKRRY